MPLRRWKNLFLVGCVVVLVSGVILIDRLSPQEPVRMSPLFTYRAENALRVQQGSLLAQLTMSCSGSQNDFDTIFCATDAPKVTLSEDVQNLIFAFASFVSRVDDGSDSSVHALAFGYFLADNHPSLTKLDYLANRDEIRAELEATLPSTEQTEELFTMVASFNSYLVDKLVAGDIDQVPTWQGSTCSALCEGFPAIAGAGSPITTSGNLQTLDGLLCINTSGTSNCLQLATSSGSQCNLLLTAATTCSGCSLSTSSITCSGCYTPTSGITCGSTCGSCPTTSSTCLATCGYTCSSCPTSSYTCLATCGTTCNYTCASCPTSSYTCLATCGTTCNTTCGTTCSSTCNYTCDYTCRSTCNYTCSSTCNYTCGGSTCRSGGCW